MAMDGSMRVNAGYAWAGCDFSVYARPTIPSHSFMTSQQTLQTASYSARGARWVMATSQTAPHLAH
jgi:hypothetical protein